MRRILGITGAQGWGGGCLRGNREESSGGSPHRAHKWGAPKGSYKGHSVLPEDGLPEEVGWRSLRRPQGRMPSLET